MKTIELLLVFDRLGSTYILLIIEDVITGEQGKLTFNCPLDGLTEQRHLAAMLILLGHDVTVKTASNDDPDFSQSLQKWGIETERYIDENCDEYNLPEAQMSPIRISR